MPRHMKWQTLRPRRWLTHQQATGPRPLTAQIIGHSWGRFRCTVYRSLLVWLLSSTFLASAAEPMITAHRGASDDAPENTLAAFRLAWQQGADAIEGDFRLSGDGDVVCIHDADTARTGGVKLVVADTPLARAEVIDAAFVETLRRGGVGEFHVWTVDRPGDARHFARLGAVGITTNRPASIRGAVSGR